MLVQQYNIDCANIKFKNAVLDSEFIVSYYVESNRRATSWKKQAESTLFNPLTRGIGQYCPSKIWRLIN